MSNENREASEAHRVENPPVNLRFQSQLAIPLSQKVPIPQHLLARRVQEKIQKLAPHCPILLQIRLTTDHIERFRGAPCFDDTLEESIRLALINSDMLSQVSKERQIDEQLQPENEPTLTVTRSAICAPQRREDGSWLIIAVVAAATGATSHWLLVVGDDRSNSYVNLGVVCSMGKGCMRIVHSTDHETVLSLELAAEVVKSSTQHTVFLKTVTPNRHETVSLLTFFA